MICQPCRDRDHAKCPGQTWCNCQHREIVERPTWTQSG